MTIIVTGSIAVDHLTSFRGRFVDQFVPDSLDRVSLSFLVDSLDVRRGGVAANIGLGLARLGLRPVIVAAAGVDFADYRSWLERNGLDVSFIAVSDELHTARFLCTTDQDGNQIASFYPGAMSEAQKLELRPAVEQLGGTELVVISPNDPTAMLRHTDECRANDYPFAADPSQQLAFMRPTDIRRLIDGARYLFTNEYEHALVLQKTGWTEREVLTRVDTWVTTLAAKGARIESLNHPTEEVSAVAVDAEIDPTGVGDAFRAGFLAGVSWGLPDARAAQLGCALAALVLRTVGPQEYDIHPTAFANGLASTYGRTAAAEIGERLPWAR
ncbi:carbohydrate kinase family protein [Micromonospora sp. FIMYZ51]|uniref:carbohydrate kinase family protein n=1 Tax=Micromonospora sp. FIMYZ51 TaxID=3051832 RepID=UPI00311D840F